MLDLSRVQNFLKGSAKGVLNFSVGALTIFLLFIIPVNAILISIAFVAALNLVHYGNEYFKNHQKETCQENNIIKSDEKEIDSTLEGLKNKLNILDDKITDLAFSKLNETQNPIIYCRIIKEFVDFTKAYNDIENKEDNTINFTYDFIKMRIDFIKSDLQFIISDIERDIRDNCYNKHKINNLENRIDQYKAVIDDNFSKFDNTRKPLSTCIASPISDQTEQISNSKI